MYLVFVRLDRHWDNRLFVPSPVSQAESQSLVTMRWTDVAEPDDFSMDDHPTRLCDCGRAAALHSVEKANQ